MRQFVMDQLPSVEELEAMGLFGSAEVLKVEDMPTGPGTEPTDGDVAVHLHADETSHAVEGDERTETLHRIEDAISARINEARKKTKAVQKVAGTTAVAEEVHVGAA